MLFLFVSQVAVCFVTVLILFLNLLTNGDRCLGDSDCNEAGRFVGRSGGKEPSHQLAQRGYWQLIDSPVRDLQRVDVAEVDHLEASLC